MIFRTTSIAFALIGGLCAASVVVPPAAADSCPGLPKAASGGDLPRTAGRLRAGQPVKILAIGSSSTSGVGAGGGGSFPRVIETDLRARFPGKPIALVQSGVSGETAPRTAERLASAVAAGDIDLVVWQVGTNDVVFGLAADSFQAALDRGVAAVRQARSDLILVDPQHYNSSVAEQLESYTQRIAASGRKTGSLVIGRYTWMRDVANAKTGNLLAFDRFHMNALGHECLGLGIAAEIARRAGTGGMQSSARARS